MSNYLPLYTCHVAYRNLRDWQYRYTNRRFVSKGLLLLLGVEDSKIYFKVLPVGNAL